MVLPEMALEARMVKPTTTCELVGSGQRALAVASVARTHHHNVGAKGNDDIADFTCPIAPNELQGNVEEGREQGGRDEEEEQSQRELPDDSPDGAQDLVRIRWLL